jgi:hypothetical protein
VMDRDFSLLCARLGGDPWYTQGAGGNASVKFGDVLMVKASGWRLDRALQPEAWTALRLSEARQVACSGMEDFSGALIGMRRASIETGLHALSLSRLVLHLHFVPLLAEAIRVDGRARLDYRLKGLDWTWVPYSRPGAALAAACNGRQASIMVLDRHGVVLNGNDAAEIDALLCALEARLSARPTDVGLRFDHPLAQLAPVFPDQAVFLGPRAIGAGFAPVVTDSGGLVRPAPGASLGACDQLAALALLAPLVPPDAPIAVLPAGEADALASWDAEIYRRQVAITANR